MTTKPTTESEDDILAKLVQWHEAADQSTVDARTESERDRDYVDGYQWTAEEVAKLKKRKQPVVTINRIKPKVDFLRGQEQQRRRMPKAFPRTPAEEEGAQAATDSIRFVMEQSRWDRERSECFGNHVVEGACGIDVIVYEKKDGDYCIETKHIPWDRMWGDPHSRKRDWSDALYKGHFHYMDVEEATQKWPEKAEILETTVAQEAEAMASDTYDDVPRTRWADPKRKRVRIAECWSRESGKVWHTVYTKAGILSRMESPYVDEDGNPDDGFVFGSCNIDRDGNRFGVVRQWISIQDEINKRRSKAMHLMNVRQTYGNPSAGDKNEIRQELAKPDGHIEMQGGAEFGKDFGILPTGDMAEAQFKLLQEAKSEIDAVGVNAALSGTEERVMSGRALISKSEQGLTELGPVFDWFGQFELDVYRKVWSRVRQFWTAEKWIRVTDDERNVRFVGLNQSITVGMQLLEEFKQQNPDAPPEQIARIEQYIKVAPEMQKVAEVKNKVAELDVDLILDDAPAAATLQVEQFEQLAQMASSGVPIPPDVLIEASSLRNKDKILERMRGGGDELPPQVQQQMQEMQQAIEQLQQEKAQVESQLTQAKASAPALEAERDRIQLALERKELEYERKLFDAQKRIALLEVRNAQQGAVHATEKLHMAEADLSAAAKEAQKATDVAQVPTD